MRGLRQFLRAVFRVLGFVFRALFFLWNMTTFYIFRALFLGFFGCCSGLLLPMVFLCIWVKNPRGTRRRYRRRGRRLLRGGAVLIGRSDLVGRYVMLCSSGQLGSYVSLCGLRDVGCRVERVEHDVCCARALLGPAVAFLRGLPVVVDLENEGGSAASAPVDGPPEVPVMEPAARDEKKGPDDGQAEGPPADDGYAEAGTVSLSSKALRDHQSQDTNLTLPIVMLVCVLRDAALHVVSKTLRRCRVPLAWTTFILVSCEFY